MDLTWTIQEFRLIPIEVLKINWNQKKQQINSAEYSATNESRNKKLQDFERDIKRATSDDISKIKIDSVWLKKQIDKFWKLDKQEKSGKRIYKGENGGGNKETKMYS